MTLRKKKEDKVGKSQAMAPDLTRDQQALLMMKELERKLKRKLVTHKLDERTIISTTKNRMKELIEMHNNPIPSR